MRTKNRSTTQTFDVNKIRSDFPILKRQINGSPLIYLDNAATTQKPLQVIESISNFYKDRNSNIHRGVHTLSYEATTLYESAHKKVADFIGASKWQEIVFTRNATESINLVAYGWGLRKLSEGDEVIITIMEHHSNIVPWQMLRDIKGIKVKVLDVDNNGELKVDEFEDLLTDKTKLVCLNHISNVLGTINPIEKIISQAKEAGALVLVDAAQSVPHHPVDVKKLDCDFLVASGHKMLAPFGIGFLYGRGKLLEDMEPFNYGGDMIESVTLEKSTWNELPWKFEAGTPNVSGGIALGEAIDYINSIGISAISDYEKKLTHYTHEKLEELDFLEIYGPPPEKKIGVFSFNIPGVHPHDVAWVLDENGIAVRSGHHCAQPLMKRLNIENAVRASLYLYNTVEEIDALIDSLLKAKKMFLK